MVNLPPANWNFEPIVKREGFALYTATSTDAPMHKHICIELAYVESGSMKHDVDGKTSIVNTGEYYIIDHSMSHAYSRISQEPLVVRNYMFSPVFLDRSLAGTHTFQDIMRSYLMRFSYQTLQDNPTSVTFQDPDGHILKLLNVIEREYAAGQYGCLEYIRCILTEVLILTMRKIGQCKVVPAKSGVVAQMLTYAQTNYDQKVRLHALADNLGYSPPYLSQKFSHEVGMTFMEYLHRIRIERSCHLLDTTNLSITEIAREVGYEDVKFFVHIFKKTLSITPREFRALSKS